MASLVAVLLAGVAVACLPPALPIAALPAPCCCHLNCRAKPCGCLPCSWRCQRADGAGALLGWLAQLGLFYALLHDLLPADVPPGG